MVGNRIELYRYPSPFILNIKIVKTSMTADGLLSFLLHKTNSYLNRLTFSLWNVD